ncbi:CcdB family protein [Cronobacter turicensis]|uniref:CcdB family protein n=1 Tax=Cronobacter turicensis TaxID=413502 RepID=UPI0024C411B5|nr:CcdB family protein [Cronobacter turicensis]MDK1236136.1 CcdB family protein [Cronobacter turicensis]
MQYQIYRNTSANKKYPYLRDIQSYLVDVLTTRIVIPLVPRFMTQKPLPERMCPVVNVDGDEYIVMTHEMASVGKSVLGQHTASALPWRQQIKNAVDFVFDGF